MRKFPIEPSCIATCLSVSFVLLLSGCGGMNQREAVMTLPVSHNEVMVALVNHAADPIWVAAWSNPKNEKEWRNLEHLAYQLQIGGALLQMPGTGPLDLQWSRDPQWQVWAGRLTTAGRQAGAAAIRRDVAAIGKAGDRIVETCEGCHLVFKPSLPTGGKFGELSPNADDIQ
jgi:hypothetical protein